jgi:hypothetical protein
MFKALLNATVILPILLGMLAARSRGQRGLALLFAFLLTHAVFNMALLYYIRHRWL